MVNFFTFVCEHSLQFWQLGSFKGSETSKRSGQVAGERSLAGGRGTQTRILTTVGLEGSKKVEVSDQSQGPQWLCHPHHMQDGDNTFGLGNHQKREHDVLHKFQWHFQILIRLNSQPYLHIALSGKIFQFRALCLAFPQLSSLHQDVFFGIRVDSQERASASVLYGRLASHNGVFPLTARASWVSPQPMHELGDCH